ncbi:MAG: nucleotidyltransferase [Blautia sp.]|nr:nucleotidyltransferase [Blautia sp.]
MAEKKKSPALVVMAAGMGSRYGGLKQMDPVDEKGHFIIDFSIYDAWQAGFGKVIFIIKKENEQAFKETVGDRVSGRIPVEYVFQELSDLPDGFEPPAGRVKPWGTAHAVLSCRNSLKEPFAVINADDFYGRDAFEKACEFLKNTQDSEDRYHYMMVGYQLGNTLTDHGHVSRGICETDEDSYLSAVHELTHIEKDKGKAVYTEDGGSSWKDIAMETIVSMNMWGFTQSFLKELSDRFPGFLREKLSQDPLKCEYYLPFVVDALLKEKKADVKVLPSSQRWFGVTYKEDKPFVMENIRLMKEKGIYPERLW